MAEVKIALSVDTETGVARISAFEKAFSSSMGRMKNAGTDAPARIEDAFKQLGIRSIASMKDEQRVMASAWVEIKKSGIASIADIQRAKEAFVARTRVLNSEIVQATRDGTEGVKTIWIRAVENLSDAWKWLKQSWIGVMTAIGASAAIIHVIRDMMREAYEAEIAFNKLKIQVENLGISYNIVGRAVEQAIEKTSRYARVQDDDVAKTLQELVLQTGNLDASMKNLNIVYDLAYQKSIDAGEAARIIGLIQEGHVETLVRLIPKLRGMNDALGEYATVAEKAAWAMRVLEEDVAGASEKMTEHEKKVRDLTNSWKDFQEVGGGLLNSFADAIVRQAWIYMNLKRTAVDVWNTFVHGMDAARQMRNKVNEVSTATKNAGESAAEMAKRIKAEADARHKATEAIKKQQEEREKLNSSIIQELVNTETEIIHLRDGEAAYLETIRARQIAQGADVRLMDLLISKMRELNDLRKEAKLYDLLEEGAKKLKKPQKSELLMSPLPEAPTPFAPGERALEEARMPGVDAINKKHTDAIARLDEERQMIDALQGSYGELAQQQAIQIEVYDTLAEVKQAMISALAQEILGQGNYVKAMKNAIAQVLAARAAESAVEAIFEMGKGFAALARYNYDAATKHFTSAGYFAAVAGAAGIVARALYSPPSAKDRGTPSNPLTIQSPPGTERTSSTSPAQPNQIVNIYIQGDVVSYDELVRKLRPYQVALERDMI